MLTDRLPVNQVLRAQYDQSDRQTDLDAPLDERLLPLAKAIEVAMASGATSKVRQTCADFLAAAADFYTVPPPGIKVLASRPLNLREGGWATELFGDYNPGAATIRVWMRTAVRKQVTSFGTFFSTLCHEFCHHLDYTKFRFTDSPHTRGFYERAAVLYHAGRGTPRKRLIWAPVAGGRWRIDWPRTTRGAAS